MIRHTLSSSLIRRAAAALLFAAPMFAQFPAKLFPAANHFPELVPAWPHFPSPAGAYTVDFPGSPSLTNEPVQNGSETMQLHAAVYQKGQERMMVLDTPVSPGTDSAKFLNGVREEFASLGTLTSVVDFRVGPYPAKRLTGTVDGNQREVIAVMTGHHFYSLWFQGADYLNQLFDEPQFISSFHFFDAGQDCNLILRPATGDLSGYCVRQ